MTNIRHVSYIHSWQVAVLQAQFFICSKEKTLLLSRELSGRSFRDDSPWDLYQVRVGAFVLGTFHAFQL